MSSHDPLKHKLWSKEGPLKIKNRPNFLACRWCVTYRSKVLNKGYNFVLDLTLIGVFHKKLWASKVARVQILGISELPFGSPRKK
jgi:hypothetical protein